MPQLLRGNLGSRIPYQGLGLRYDFERHSWFISHWTVHSTSRANPKQSKSVPPGSQENACLITRAAYGDTMANLSGGKPQGKEQSGLRYPTNGKTIYHRPLNRTKTAELSQASFAYLFSEMVSYAQRRVTGIQDLEKRWARSLAFLTHTLSLSLFSFLPSFPPPCLVAGSG